MPMLDTNLAGIPLASPIVLAAGTAGVLDEMAGVIDLSRVGAVTTKSITPLPREGNATWRILPAGAAGMLNAIGLANPGLDVFLKDVLPSAATMPTNVFVSVAGFSIEDYVLCAANIDAFAGDRIGLSGNGRFGNVHAIELNVSCPNVRTGTEFGHTPGLLTELLRAVRPIVRHCKLFVKLSPMTPDLIGVASAACDAGVDALTLGNTIPAMAIDVRTRRPKLANITGGLSGPGLHPVAVKHVYDVYRKVTKPRADSSRPHGVPIMGAGGVLSWADAAEFILAGATAVQIGTGLFADPRTPIAVAKGLEKWTREQGRAGINELIGALELPGA